MISVLAATLLGITDPPVLPGPVARKAESAKEAQRSNRRTQIPSVPNSDRLGSDETARALQRFASCFVKRYERNAAALVDPPLSTTSNFRRVLFRRAQGQMRDCVTIQRVSVLSTEQFVLLGAFAEQLYRKRFPSLPALGPINLPEMTHPDQISWDTALRFSNCLIDKDARTADRLVRSEVLSREEAASINTLSSYYSGCLNAGQTLKLNRLALRTTLADQMYRRASAGSALSAPGGF